MTSHPMRIGFVWLAAALTFFGAVENIGATGLLNNKRLLRAYPQLKFVPTAQTLSHGRRPQPPQPVIQPSSKPQIYQVPHAVPFTFPVDDAEVPEYRADANSPAIWEGDELVLFNSAGHPWRSTGRDIRNMSTI
ncbi:MAG TPA: hypothetical protein VFV50_12155, partial [Bdellovibrionales bacterium]|nr:hypothetical protein [Bdellovibrionales bacterium]